MKKFWLHSLLKVYAVIMVAIVGCLGLILSYSDRHSRYNETEQINWLKVWLKIEQNWMGFITTLS